MKPLRTFFMEDYLENFRFDSQFNLGESGGRPRTTQELLTHSGLSISQACDLFLNTKLCDSPNRGRDDLRELVANLHEGATKENVLITTGTSEALFLLFRYLRPESVALALPAFQLLYELPQALNSKIIPLPVRWNEHGAPFVDEQEWISILKKQKPSCLLINNPHNPSGLVLSESFIHLLSQTAEQINCTLIGDEHYRFLSSDSDILGSTVYRNNGSTFVTGSFIKCLGAPGLRIGWCVGPKSALDCMQNEKNYTTHTVNPISEWIAFEVLKNLESNLFTTMKQEWIANKKTLGDFLKNSKFIYGVPPAGGLVTSLSFRDAAVSSSGTAVSSSGTAVSSFGTAVSSFGTAVSSPGLTGGSSNQLIDRLLKNKLFVLPLSSMEFGAFEFQKSRNNKETPLCDINKGLGFRLGLGCHTHVFANALERLEEILGV